MLGIHKGKKVSGIEDIFNPDNPEPFLKKHRKSILAMWAMAHPDEYEKEHKKVCLAALLFIVSTLISAINVIIVPMEPRTNLYVSKSNNEHSFIHMMTMPWPILTPPAIEKWATHAITNILSVGFTDYDQHMKAIRPYFSSDGYAGIKEAFDKGYKDQIVNEGENVVTVPDGVARMTHYPNRMEKWFTIEIPIISSFDNGNEKTIRSRSGVAVITIEPASGDSAEYGKVIRKISIE